VHLLGVGILGHHSIEVLIFWENHSLILRSFLKVLRWLIILLLVMRIGLEILLLNGDRFGLLLRSSIFLSVYLLLLLLLLLELHGVFPFLLKFLLLAVFLRHSILEKEIVYGLLLLLLLMLLLFNLNSWLSLCSPCAKSSLRLRGRLEDLLEYLIGDLLFPPFFLLHPLLVLAVQVLPILSLLPQLVFFLLVLVATHLRKGIALLDVHLLLLSRLLLSLLRELLKLRGGGDRGRNRIYVLLNLGILLLLWVLDLLMGRPSVLLREVLLVFLLSLSLLMVSPPLLYVVLPWKDTTDVLLRRLLLVLAVERLVQKTSLTNTLEFA